jgi:hypothetical protein
MSDRVSWPGRIDATRNSTTSHMDDSDGVAYLFPTTFLHKGNIKTFNTQTYPAVGTASKSNLQTCWVTSRPRGRSLAVPASRVNADVILVTLAVDDAYPKESIVLILMLRLTRQRL